MPRVSSSDDITNVTGVKDVCRDISAQWKEFLRHGRIANNYVVANYDNPAITIITQEIFDLITDKINLIKEIRSTCKSKGVDFDVTMMSVSRIVYDQLSGVEIDFIDDKGKKC